MSAANLIVGSDGAHLISDALVWSTADQTITAICNKATLLPQFRAAATIRAEHFVVFQAVSLALSTIAASGFDEFQQAIGPTLKELNDRMAAMGAASPFEVSVAGISEQGGPSAFRMTTLQAGSEHIEPWQIVEMPRGFSPCPCNTESQETEIRVAIEKAPASLDGHVIAALKTQGDIASRDFTEGRTPCWVGGFGQLTTIGASGISTRIIPRWPNDVVGQKLVSR
ncbi:MULTISPECIES: hypothetical protein [unclassified Bradyrhizobium]|uniref:hypothetical protein n=1 Tax=unclassified Bradyrhizobium TaxID=2631580 RepID=UPI001FFBC000|nr:MULTISPECIES: hypothetical protein [unclassified Bradyrhizobium]MCK1295320.1 hypothetical protein [Bradyrhizobium sp. 30]MCK1311897.1 hypothetical protein [Bradyrhizobium sp. 45]MCK1328665.1 hypothetical protein [Bradyrhizobium sp. CW9]MCK1348601.1 hypothetical protein [Bradyrhizobium sp. CW11]MCK1351502.1 hypothetical protein [Bradyrhizobium sp. CW7]